MSWKSNFLSVSIFVISVLSSALLIIMYALIISCIVGESFLIISSSSFLLFLGSFLINNSSSSSFNDSNLADTCDKFGVCPCKSLLFALSIASIRSFLRCNMIIARMFFGEMPIVASLLKFTMLYSTIIYLYIYLFVFGFCL